MIKYLKKKFSQEDKVEYNKEVETIVKDIIADIENNVFLLLLGSDHNLMLAGARQLTQRFNQACQREVR